MIKDLKSKHEDLFKNNQTIGTALKIVTDNLTKYINQLGTLSNNLNGRKKLLAEAATKAEEALSSKLPSADEPEAQPQEPVPPVQDQQPAPAPSAPQAPKNQSPLTPPAASNPQAKKPGNGVKPENNAQDSNSSSRGDFAGSHAQKNGGNLNVVPGVGSMDASPSAPVPSTPQNAPQNNAAPSAPQEPAPQSAPKHSAAPANQTEPANTAKAAEELVENATDKSQATAQTPARTHRAAASAAQAAPAAPAASSASATKSEDSKNTSTDSASSESQSDSEDSKSEESKSEDKSSDKSAQASGANNSAHAEGNNTTLIAAVAGSITAGIAAIGAGWHFMRIRRK